MSVSFYQFLMSALAVYGLASHGQLYAGSGVFYEEAPIHYSDTDPQDPLAKLIERIEAGEVRLNQWSEKGFLKSLLRELDVPVESQVLVFSKTSLQNHRILPSRPRALYFSDDYYVGWVQGGDIEVISIDPQLGPVFYLLKVPRRPNENPMLIRSAECMNCHGGTRTGGVPGMLIRSVRPDTGGFPILSAGTHSTDHTSPLRERWGGWYVTGENGGERHMGNLLYKEGDRGSATMIRDHGTVEDLDQVFNTGPYLTNKSDIVALMVMEHQITVHNALTKARFNTLRWLHYDTALSDHLDSTKGELRKRTLKYIQKEAATLLAVMLFKDEFQLESWGIEGSEAFQNAFLAKAPRSEDERSLKDFELLSRLFRHRFSYMIYSRSFDYLPKLFKVVFYSKLSEVLAGKNPEFDYLGAKERQRILTILLETKPEFAQHFDKHRNS